MPFSIRLSALLVALILAPAMMLAPLPVVQAAGTIIRVAPTGTDSASCGSAASPCRTINHAISRIRVSGDVHDGEVRVAAGTYTGTGESVVRFTGRGTIIIRGGYTSANFETSNPTTNVTTIDGQDARRGVAIVVGNDVTTCNVTLDGFTVQNGRATTVDGITTTFGGGILVDICAVTLRNMVVQNNIAQGANGADPTSVNAAGAGGGIAARGAATNNVTTIPVRLTLSNVTIADNEAVGTSGISPRGGIGFGGGLYVFGGIVTADGLTVSNNLASGGNSGGNGVTGFQYADGGGGGIAIIVSPGFTLNNATITGNTARGGNAGGQGGFGLGGGIKIELANNGRISNTLFDQNVGVGGTGSTAGSGNGGGIFSTDSDLALDRVTLIRNQAVGQDSSGTAGNAGGGGITTTKAQRQIPSTLTMVNTVVAGNNIQRGVAPGGDGAYGGGLSCDGTTLTIDHSTFSGNTISGPEFRDGPAMSLSVNCPATIRTSIIANHPFPRASIFVNPNGGPITLSRNLFFNNGGTGNVISYGSPTINEQNSITGNPQFVDAAGFDFHIGSNSAAKDQAAGSTTKEDFDGDARPFNGVADIGADEFSNILAVATTPGGTETTVSWTPLKGVTVTGYALTIVPPIGNPPGTLPANATGVVLTGLDPDTSYTITVDALDGAQTVGSGTGFRGANLVYLPQVSKD